jgi:hypothetical protein
MSQIYKPLSATPPPPGFVETLTGNTGGPVGPDASDNINVIGDGTITIAGNPGTNTLTASIGNSATGTGQTIGAVTADIITIPLSTTPTTYTIEARIAAFEATGPNSAGFSLFATVQSGAVSAILIVDTDKIKHASVPIDTSDANIVVSGDNAIVRVTGVVGLTIDWSAFSVYISRS